MWWSRNYFADVTPIIHWLMSGMAGRLLVGTAGVVTAFVGLSDLRYVLFHRRQDPEPFGPPADR